MLFFEIYYHDNSKPFPNDVLQYEFHRDSEESSGWKASFGIERMGRVKTFPLRSMAEAKPQAQT